MSEHALPRSVAVGFRRYRITRDARDVPGAAGDQNGYAGRTLHTDGWIYIDPEIPYQEARETFLHELMHAGISSSGVQDTLAAHVRTPDSDPEETYVRAIASTVLAALDNNPTARAYIWPSQHSGPARP